MTIAAIDPNLDLTLERVMRAARSGGHGPIRRCWSGGGFPRRRSAG